MAPVTSSTECLTQVYAVSSFAKIHDTATTVHSELALDLIHQEVEQTTTAQATPSIGTRASLYRRGRPSHGDHKSTTNVDPKASMQELDDSPLPSFNTSPSNEKVGPQLLQQPYYTGTNQLLGRIPRT
ncbi:hypothetical protein ZWY2020_005592 [Hordeum vulgare]|nr:hypothetical protein ZWY2020_005592 [Hordeum vulgare]